MSHSICYWMAEACRNGHITGCPFLEMSPAQRTRFFGTVAGATQAEKVRPAQGTDFTSNATTDDLLDYKVLQVNGETWKVVR